jgi:hypothetical protein
MVTKQWQTADQIENASKLVNIGEVSKEDWDIMLGLSRVGRIAFLESLDEQRRDAYNDAEVMLYKAIETYEDTAVPFTHYTGL